MRGIGGDTDPLEIGEHMEQGQFDLAHEGCAAAFVELLLEGIGKLESGAGVQAESLEANAVGLGVETQLGGRTVIDCGELAAQEPRGEVAEVERALTRQDKIGRKCGVARETAEVPTPCADRELGAFRVMECLGP
ncbi:unannotated protein [freshwater metagenome]|uniref:Unannotated protein n=1 Tax=freshwater metagenome TaxID=449393 RepID=A0A6J7C6Q9_9ZZZZ